MFQADVKPTVLVVLTYGMCARNFLRSKAFELVKTECRVVLWTPLSGDPEFRREFESVNVSIPRYRRPSFLSRALGTVLSDAATFSFLQKKPIETFRIIGETIRRGVADETLLQHAGVFSRRSRWLSHFPSVFSWFLRCWFRASDRTFRSLLQRVQPSLVYVTHPHAGPDRILAAAAQQRGVPVAAIVHSWDNITSKHLWLNRFDWLLVWNDILRRQAEEIYRFPPDRIRVIGMPQLDFIGSNPPFVERDEFLRAQGLDPSRKLITFACGSPDFIPDQPQILRDLLALIEEDRLGAPSQLVIRSHPGKPMKEIEALAGSLRVKMNWPSAAYGALAFTRGWDGSGGDYRFFVNLLRHTDVFVNCFSTTTIEAAALDRPIVNIAYDGRRSLDYYASCRKHYDFDHYRDIVRSGGVWIVKSREELAEAVSTYLQDPAAHREGRQRIVREQCGALDGGAGRRIGEGLLEVLRGAPVASTQGHRTIRS